MQIFFLCECSTLLQSFYHFGESRNRVHDHPQHTQWGWQSLEITPWVGFPHWTHEKTEAHRDKVSGPHLECTGSQNAMIMWEPKGHSFIDKYSSKAGHRARFQELRWTGEVPDFLELIFLDILPEKKQVNTQDDTLSLSSLESLSKCLLL